MCECADAYRKSERRDASARADHVAEDGRPRNTLLARNKQASGASREMKGGGRNRPRR